ncbi:MAG: recombinase family protein [Janthinobacterium lividum]
MSSLADRNRGAPAKASKPLRCAIYTRKSTEYGLEQEFNSLDNQREAGEAYVKSQAHEGWRQLPDLYDDGGFSGGSLERPALKRLLGEVEAGRVDIVVVYKVDRLTRSLADFAKLVELFDRHGVSFVSVTQAFNTTNSMGRLTLNVLLSFAQFEREVTGERIRDKIAASRRKGMRTGGPVPLGYRVVEKKLVPEPTEAETVRSLFARYLATGTLGALMAELDAGGVVTKVSPRRDGSVRGGVRFTMGSLAALLKNRCYVGEVVHKGQHFPGEHAAIVDREVFEAVQKQLTAGARRAGQGNRAAAALLTGLIRDSRGHRMTPSTAQKKGLHYRYYVSCALIQGRKAEAGSRPRVAGPDVEALVLEALRGAGQSPPDEAEAQAAWLGGKVLKVTVEADRLQIALRSASGDEAGMLTVPWPAPLRRRRGILGAPEDAEVRPIRAEARARLVHAIADGRAWLADLASGRARDTHTIALREGFSDRHVRTTINLALLAPDIVKAAVAGTLPDGIGVVRMGEVGMDWVEQRAALQLVWGRPARSR